MALLVRRIVYMVPVLFGVTLVVFFAIRLVPGDALTAQLEGAYLGQETMDQIRQELGLDLPVWQQYLNWLGGLARGDMGDSLYTGRPVAGRLAEAIPATAELATLSMLFAALIGVSIGIVSAVRRGSWVDGLGRAFSVAGLSVPTFVLATVVIALPALWFNYYPNLFYLSPVEDIVGNLQIVLPAAIALGLHVSAVSMRQTRSSMLEVLNADYVRTATAKGLGNRVVLVRHALRNALLPVLSVLGVQFGYLLGGTVITENIFGIPGVGQLTLEALARRDYTQLQGNVFFIALVFLVVNLVVDLLYGRIDPRVRFS